MRDIASWIKDMTISVRELFMKGAVSKYLRECLEFACLVIKRPVPRIRFIDVPKEPPAYTNGRRIVINYASTFIADQESREDKLLMSKGLAVHEYGHYRFTDFLLLRETIESAQNKKLLYPPVPETIMESRQYQDMETSLSSLSGASFAYFLKDIHNILEDGYVEEGCFRTLSGGLVDALWFMRNYRWRTTEPLNRILAMRKEDIADDYDVTSSLLLQYSLYGKFKYDPGAAEERETIQALRDVLPYVDEILYADQPFERAGLCNIVFVLLWDIIKPLIQKMTESGETGKALIWRDGRIAGIPEGDTRGVIITESEDRGMSGSRKERRKTAEELSATEDDTEPPSEDSSGKGELEAEQEGETEYEDYSPDEEVIRAELDRDLTCIERDALEEKAEEAAEMERAAELESVLEELPLTPIHRGRKRQLIRNVELPEGIEEESADFFRECEDIAEVLARKLEPELKKRNDDLPLSGCMSGSRFDITRLVYNDCRYFKQNVCPNTGGGTAVTILVDESGSMMCDERIEMARAAAAVLYLFCQRLQIPCAVIGHTANFSDGSLVVSVYADYSGSEKDKYRILGISAREDNRDGAAISYAGELLLQRPEDTKLLIIICDGEPCAKGYIGLPAEEDMKNIVRELSRRHVTTFAAAIGEDKLQINHIFGEGFLDITDLETLPDQLLDLVHRYIRM